MSNPKAKRRAKPPQAPWTTVREESRSRRSSGQAAVRDFRPHQPMGAGAVRRRISSESRGSALRIPDRLLPVRRSISRPRGAAQMPTTRTKLRSRTPAAPRTLCRRRYTAFSSRCSSCLHPWLISRCPALPRAASRAACQERISGNSHPNSKHSARVVTRTQAVWSGRRPSSNSNEDRCRGPRLASRL